MKKPFMFPLFLLLILHFFSCSSIEMTGTDQVHYGEPLGPRAFITGSTVDINGNPAPYDDISYIMENRKDTLPQGFQYLAVLAKSDSTGKLFGVVIGKLKDDDTLFPGKQLGELRVKLMAVDPATRKFPVYKHVKFEYDSIGRHVRFGGLAPLKIDTVFIKKFAHTDIGDIVALKADPRKK
jgi:hypothetical protein